MLSMVAMARPRVADGTLVTESQIADRSVEGAIQVVDSTTAVRRAFIHYGGLRAHGHSLTVAAR